MVREPARRNGCLAPCRLVAPSFRVRTWPASRCPARRARSMVTLLPVGPDPFTRHWARSRLSAPLLSTRCAPGLPEPAPSLSRPVLEPSFRKRTSPATRRPARSFSSTVRRSRHRRGAIQVMWRWTVEPGRAAVLLGLSRKVPTVDTCVLTVTELLAGIRSVVRDLALAGVERVVGLLPPELTSSRAVMLVPLASEPSEQDTNPGEPTAGTGAHAVDGMPETPMNPACPGTTLFSTIPCAVSGPLLVTVIA